MVSLGRNKAKFPEQRVLDGGASGRVPSFFIYLFKSAFISRSAYKEAQRRARIVRSMIRRVRYGAWTSLN